MNVTLIKSDEEYETVMEIYKKLFRKKQRTEAEEERLEILGLLIDNWEQNNYSIDFGESDPIDIIKFMMDQNGISPSDMIQYIGSQSKVSEVLNRRRPLSINMIRNISKGLHIPAQLLISEYKLAV
jgi:HTH-type transcriptional regulator/antitoxin HigA